MSHLSTSSAVASIACSRWRVGILRDVDRAEDALQEPLVIAWRDLPDLRDPDRFDFWIQRVLSNTCIEHARRDRRRHAKLQVLDVAGHAAPDELKDIVDRDVVDRAFRRLTPEERTILVLRHYLGYEPAVIAEVLGLPGGTVRSRLHHAHRAMPTPATVRPTASSKTWPPASPVSLDAAPGASRGGPT
jgi:RNA polymerase sigma-70 factor (ECF subfamily)